jgi:hypothetical protein
MALSQKQQVQIITRAARSAGIKPAILWGLYGQESDFGRNKNVSSAGAQGPFQFMPETAKSYGINPYNFRQAAFAAAKYLATYKGRGVKGMLAAYNAGPAGNPNNPETRAYVPSVLAKAKSFPGAAGGSLGGTVGGGGPGGSVTIPGASGAASVPEGSQGALALIQALSQEKQGPPSVGLQAPAFSAQAVLPQGYQAPAAGAVAQPKTDIAGLLSAIQTSGAVPALGGSPDLTVSIPGGGQGGGASMPGVKGGKVTIAPGADRAGVPIKKDVVNFIKGVSALTGQKLTIGTGTNHSRLTINGTESDHWRGQGADVPATGKTLIQLGRAALIEAGMPASKARKVTGGGFNVGGWQVIFNTDAPGWGDHTTHLHVGRRR